MTQRLLTLLFAAFLLSIAVPTASPAQTQPNTEFEGLIEVTEVLLDVLVTDKKGNVIVGLGPEDFIVEEDGEEVEVTGATFYSNREFLEGASEAELAGVDPEDVPVDRYFILLIHDQRQDYAPLLSQQLDMARYAKRWAKRELLANDWVAVASYDVKLKIHQDFTRDADAVVRGIENAALGKDPGAWPSRRDDAGAGTPSLLDHLPSGDELRDDTWNVYHGFRLLAEASGHVRARKNLLFFSIGFGEVNEAGFWDEDKRYYPPMVEALNDNNVAVYTIDMLPTSEGGNILGRSLNDSLSKLADDTGGRFYRQFVNFLAPLERVTDDNNGYYLLSFNSQHPAGGDDYRRVEVETRNPEFRVRARQGYVPGT